MAGDSADFSSADSGGGGGFSFGGLGDVAKGATSAVGSLFGGNAAAAGSNKAADLYEKAAQYEGIKTLYYQEEARIQTIQQQRKVFQTLGAQQAAIGAAGFNPQSGSSLYLMRDSTQQGKLGEGLIRTQEGLNETNANIEAEAYRAQAESARAAAKAQKGGGILGALGSVAGMIGPLVGLFSDATLKTQITLIRTVNGINWYSFVRDGKHEEGVLAQELLDILPEAVHLTGGLYRVDYEKVLEAMS